jgi:uncharacterized protein involved in outer membrane biogenesis
MGILAGIVVILLAALVATPALIDWTRFKDDLAVRMEGALGRKLSIDGRVSFAFLPSPTFFAETVHLADADGVSIALPRLEVRPRLWPLVAGRLEIASLVLVSPEIHLTRWIQDHGRLGIDGTPTPPPEPPASTDGGAGPAPKTSTIDSVTIANGTLIYQPAGRPAWRFDKVGASFAAQSGGGGRLVGSARLAGLDVAFEAVQGSAAPGQAAPVNLTLTTSEGAGVLRLGGQLTGAGETRRLKGKLSFKAGDLSRLARALEGSGAGSIPVPLGNVGLEAAVGGSVHEIDLDALTVTVGGVEGTGNASLALDATPQIDVKLAFGRLDLDSLLAGLRGVAPAASGGGGAPPSNGPAAEAPAPAGFVVPTNFSATVDLGAEVTVFHGGLLRGAHVNAVLANGEVTVNQASLSLPGNTEVNLFGFLVSPGGVPSFEGSFEAASDDLRGMLDWLKIDTASVPAERLHAARLAGKLTAHPGEIALGGTQMRLDGTLIDAAATLRLGDRPALGVSFAVDSLNADAYWPRSKDDGQPAATASVGEPGEAAATVPTSWLTHLDANVKGRIGQLTARGLTAQEVTVDGAWLQGQLALHDFSVGDLMGAQLHLDGAIDGLAEGAVGFHTLRYTLRSKQPDRLIRQLALTLPVDADRLGAVALSGTLDGRLDALAIDSRSEIAGGVANIAGKIQNPLAAGRFDGSVEISHANLAQFVRVFAPDYRPSGTLGALAATSHVSGDSQALQLSDLHIKAGPVTADGEGRLLLAGKPRIDVTLSAGEIPLDGFLPGNRLADSRPPLRGGTEAPPEPHHGIPAVATDRVSAAPRTAVLSGAIPERWSHQPHDLAWLNAFDGALKLDAKALSLGRTRLDRVTLGLDLANGTLSLQRLAAQLYDGKLSGDGHLSADGGVALQLGLAHAQMRSALLGTGDVDVADGTMDGALALSTSGLSTAEWIGRLAGTGKFTVLDGVVRGFDLKAVDDRLQGSDSPTGLLALLQAGLSGGKTHFSSLAGTIGVGNGLIASDDIRLQADGGSGNATVQINLPAYVMDGRAEFHLAGAAGPPLVMRLSGPLDGPHRYVDINEIQQWLVSRGKVKPKDLLKGLLKDLGH